MMQAGLSIDRFCEEKQEADFEYDRFKVAALLPANAGGEAEEDLEWRDDTECRHDPDLGIEDYATDDELYEDRDPTKYPDADPNSDEAKQRRAALVKLYKKLRAPGRPQPRSGRNLAKQRWVEVLLGKAKEERLAAAAAQTPVGKAAAKRAADAQPKAPAAKRRKTAAKK